MGEAAPGLAIGQGARWYGLAGLRPGGLVLGHGWGGLVCRGSYRRRRVAGQAQGGAREIRRARNGRSELP